MIPLTPAQATDLLPSETAVDQALLRFEGIASPQFWRPGDCRRMIDEGWVKLATLAVNSRPAYLIGYHLTDDGGLWLDLAQRIPDAPIGSGLDSCALLAAGAEQLARQLRCRYLRFYTRRRGLAAHAGAFGFTAEAVMLTKGLA